MKLPKYLAWLRVQPCAYCGRTPSHPHHCGQHGSAKRNHDEDAIPLCHLHHTGNLGIHLGKIKIPDIVQLAKKYYNKWLEETKND